eukprot:RCo000500
MATSRTATEGAAVAAAAPAPAEDIARKYKHLEANKRDWAAETEKELRRQKQELQQLRKDNEQLKQQVMLAQTASFGIARTAPDGSTIHPSSGSTRRLQKVKEMDQRKETFDNLSSMVESEEQKSDELSAKLITARDAVKTARTNMGGVNVTRDGNNMIANQVHVLENRLDKALVKFNEALHINKQLREQIDSLRRERAVFDTIYKKLERELQEKKKEMAFIIEVSNIAYEERDNAQSELSQLKLYASKELQSFDETFKELDELLEEDRKMKEGIRARMLESGRARDDAKSKASGSALEDDLLGTGGGPSGGSGKKKKMG